ncbi:MAG: hypothetical protein NTZ56_14180 [Acidobacteria bacterium]|nr:hypothetical protein [Acidobacteriota bacterium]
MLKWFTQAGALGFGLLILGPPLTAADFAIVGPDGAWPKILSAVGNRQVARVEDATLVVIRAGQATQSFDWVRFVESGRFLILEGVSPAAEGLGFRASGQTAMVSRELDSRAAGNMIIWENPAAVPVVSLPAGASVFVQDRWSNTALLAGVRRGTGGILWVAADPGPNGYERFPYLLQSLYSLGFQGSLKSRRILSFYDYSYRSRTDPEYLARRWREQGIASLHISSWYFFERDASRDEYLTRLIQACHRNGILAHAWLELPHVSERFWDENPGCREKNALLQDAAIYWRKNMNLVNPECRAKVERRVRDLLGRFDWDGVNLAELYFEGPRGLDDLSEVTPLNDDMRRDFKTQYGFDPAALFDPTSASYYASNPRGLQNFFQYRRDLQYRLHTEWLDVLADVRSQKTGFAITICYLEDLLDPRMQDLIGADAARLLKLQPKYEFFFQIQDPSSLWGEGPSRYARAAELYRAVAPRFDMMSVDINVVARPSISFPTLHQTGTEFFQLVNTSQQAFPEVMLYFEGSILRPDAPLLEQAHALAREYRWDGAQASVDFVYPGGVPWKGPANVNGKPWPYQSDSVVWLPAGKFTITPRDSKPPLRLTDFNGTIRGVEEVVIGDGSGIAFIYKAGSRAIAVLDQKPGAIWIDGKEAQPTQLARRDGSVALLLPAGEHWVTIAAPAK